jgi:hypothetical protein
VLSISGQAQITAETKEIYAI